MLLLLTSTVPHPTKHNNNEMRSTTFAIAGLMVSVVSGVGLPACAGSCVTTFGSCGNLDVKCICSSTNLIAGLACCVSTACNAADQERMSRPPRSR